MDLIQIVAIVCFIISVVFAVVDNGWRNPLLWAVWSFAVLAVFAGVSLR
jgi:hypothetical protein